MFWMKSTVSKDETVHSSTTIQTSRASKNWTHKNNFNPMSFVSLWHGPPKRNYQLIHDAPPMSTCHNKHLCTSTCHPSPPPTVTPTLRPHSNPPHSHPYTSPLSLHPSLLALTILLPPSRNCRTMRVLTQWDQVLPSAEVTTPSLAPSPPSGIQSQSDWGSFWSHRTCVVIWLVTTTFGRELNQVEERTNRLQLTGIR